MGPNQVKKQQLQQRLMQAIGLSSDQRMRMQEIRRSHVDELAAAGRRLRQSRQALDQAIMSEPYSEADVRRATEALAAAQADKIRIDATVRTQVRGILTSDQVQRFHQLQREMRREMKDQQQRNQDREQGLNRLTTPATNAEPGEIDLLSLVFPPG
jgi:Spy/CpxP family protein refolding chaperone